MQFKIKKIREVLKNKYCNEITKSISLLYVIKKHPQYAKNKKKIFFIFKKILKKIFFDFFIFLKFLLFDKKNNRKKLDKVDLLIISHFINLEQINKKKEFYLANLENILKKNNKSYLKLLINHTSHDSKTLNSNIKIQNWYILEKFLDFKTELMIFIKKIRSVFDLLYLLLYRKINTTLFFNLLISLFGSETSNAIKIFYEVKRIIKLTNPRFLIITYEGFSWERMAILAAREVNKNITCIGCQHTLITKNHISIFNNLQNTSNPDLIWSSHLNSKKLLDKKLKGSNIKIIFTGNLKENIKKIQKKKRKNLNFLVIPEGIDLDIIDLFRFTYLCAKKYPNYKFFWRLHPVIKINTLFDLINIKKSSLPKNIMISKNSLEKDIEYTNYAIYTGSAAILNSTINGCFPIYFHNKNRVDYNPLKSFFKKENYIKNTDDLKILVEKTKKKKKKINNKVLQVIKKNFFSEIQEKSILSLIR